MTSMGCVVKLDVAGEGQCSDVGRANKWVQQQRGENGADPLPLGQPLPPKTWVTVL